MGVLFDLLIISISWILSIVGSFDFNGKGGNGVQVIRLLRTFRILSKIDSWKEVLIAISSSIPKLGCIGCIHFYHFVYLCYILYRNLQVSL